MPEPVQATEQHISSSIVYHNTDVQHRYYLLIPSPNTTEFTVLLQKTDDDMWAIPSFEPYEHHYAVVQHINDSAKETWGLDVAVLRCFATHSDPEQGEIRFYALDNISKADWQCPEGMKWANEHELAYATIASNLQRNILMEWFQWRHSDDSLRSAWMRSGWYPKLAHWMVDLADRMSMRGIKTPHQVRIWARSATMRLETDDGTLFLKAVPEFFNYEPVITRVLSIRYPDRAPDVRAVHVENGWMLMREFQGTTLTHVNDIKMWERTIKEFARLQIDMISNTQSLVALGVPDRNVDYLASQVERLMNDLPDTLNDDEKYKLRTMSSTLRSMCHELAEFNIPLTLTHGDFWSGQVVFKDDGKCLFFDWSDAAISHPFFDMCTFLAEVNEELPHVPNARNHLLMIYLNEWTRYEPLPNLKHAYALSMVLGYLHQALFYYVHILPKVENAARWELSGMLTYLLRHVLNEMQDFQD
ncbi:MAG: phosphotransferase [Phototrophicaceae bacterium]